MAGIIKHLKSVKLIWKAIILTAIGMIFNLNIEPAPKRQKGILDTKTPTSPLAGGDTNSNKILYINTYKLVIFRDLVF